jgi:hypothetical protein
VACIYVESNLNPGNPAASDLVRPTRSIFLILKKALISWIVFAPTYARASLEFGPTAAARLGTRAKRGWEGSARRCSSINSESREKKRAGEKRKRMARDRTHDPRARVLLFSSWPAQLSRNDTDKGGHGNPPGDILSSKPGRTKRSLCAIP